MILTSAITKCPSKINYGETLVVEWQLASSKVSHELKISIGDTNYSTFCEPGISSQSIELSGNIGNEIAKLPVSTSSKVSVIIVKLITYDENDEPIISGIDSKNVIVNIVEHEETIPTLTNFEVQPHYDSQFPQKLSNLYISGYVTPKFIVSGIPGYGTNIKTCNITEESGMLEGYDFSYDNSAEEMEYSGKEIYKSGTFTYVARLENDRGFISNTLSSQINVLSYFSPIISDFTVERGGDSSGATMTAVFTCNYALNSEGNTASAVIEYRKGFDDWKECYTYSSVINGKNQAVISISGGFDEFSSYYFRITATDLIGSSDSTTCYVPSVNVFLHFPENEKGFGIGRRVEQEGHFEVGFESDFYSQANFKQNINVDGLIKGENFGRDVFAGKSNCIMDTGNLTDNFKVRIYLIKPFNFVYFRMYINGLATKYTASLNSYILCHLKGEFAPAYYTPFAVSGGRNCDVLIDTYGRLQLKAWDDVPADAIIYISGFYPLSSDSPLYIQNASRTVTLY